MILREGSKVFIEIALLLASPKIKAVLKLPLCTSLVQAHYFVSVCQIRFVMQYETVSFSPRLRLNAVLQAFGGSGDSIILYSLHKRGGVDPTLSSSCLRVACQAPRHVALTEQTLWPGTDR